MLNDLLSFGGITAIIGLVLTLWGWNFTAARANRRKQLICDNTIPLALASVLPNSAEHKLSIIYEQEGQQPIHIQGAFLSFVRIGNVGREPIKREDIAPSDKLRLEVTGARVLDIALSGVSRETINFSISPFIKYDDITIAEISFDFLDYYDGAFLRVLTEHRTSDISLKGTVIGMPQGMIYQNETLRRYSFLLFGPLWLTVSLILLLIAGFILSRNILPNWQGIMVFIAAMVLFACSPLAAFFASRNKRSRWSHTLLFPEWFTQEQDIELRAELTRKERRSSQRAANQK